MTRTIRRTALVAVALVAVTLSFAITPHAVNAQAVPLPDAPVLLRSGQFFNAGETGNGTALLYRLADGTHLLRLEDFRVDFGPDLRVQFTSAADGSVLDIGGLRANRGNQDYALPATFDPDRYDATRIHCRFFRIVMIVAPLAGGTGY